MAALGNKPIDGVVCPAPETSRKSKVRLDYIDGLRAVACLYVVMYHLFLLWPVASHSSGTLGMRFLALLTRFAAYGHVGVDVFLALSGFCLFYPLCLNGGATHNLLPRLDLDRYARRRARRILPPYLAALMLFSILPFWSTWAAHAYPMPTLAQFVSHLLLIHNLLPSAVLTIDGPLWSLALEAQLYLLFPLLVIMFRRLGPLRFVSAVFVTSLGFRLLAWYFLGGRLLAVDGQFALMDSLPGRIFEFASGMGAAYILTRPSGAIPAGRLRLVSIIAMLCGSVLAYLADKRFGEHSPFPTLLWGIAAFGLIVGAAPSVLPQLRILASRRIVQLGLMSYSIYLIHEPALRFSGWLVRQAGVAPTVSFGLFVVAAGPTLLGFCALFYLVVERPFVFHSAPSGQRGARGTTSVVAGVNS